MQNAYNIVRKVVKKMYLTVKQQLNHLTKTEYLILRELCAISKRLYNQALYEYRQEYFGKRSEKVKWYSNIKLFQGTENYSLLQAQISQHTLKAVQEEIDSFWNKKKNNPKTRLPKYLKDEDFFELRIPHIPKTVEKYNWFEIPYSKKFSSTHEKVRIKIPTFLVDKKLKYIRIVPKYNARFFEIRYTYEVISKEKKNNDNILAIDFGINNLCTCADTKGKTFIIDGRKLKSYNQWYNKRIGILSKIKDKQKYKGFTKQQYKILRKRNNKMEDYVNKSCKYIVDYCLTNNISTIVCGINKGWQHNARLGKVCNQNFTQIPFYKMRENLKYRCELNGLGFVEQEESYTSQASFLDRDFIPEWDGNHHPEYKFSGKRVKRGLYKTQNGVYLNADVNGALNILRKSNVVDLSKVLCSRGELRTPIRIRVS